MSDDKIEEFKKDGKQPVTAQSCAEKIREEERKAKVQELEKATREMLKAKDVFRLSVEKVEELQSEVAELSSKPRLDITSLLNLLR